MLEVLLELGFSKQQIARLLGVSRWTIYRRVREYGLYHVSAFSDLSDADLDQKIRDYINRYGQKNGQVFLMGYLRSLGINVPRRRLRASVTRVDPANVALKWGAVVYRRRYQVPWANSLWHLDGHHSLIRWSLVVHGCIDGFSRRIIFLHCNANNLASTVLSLFRSAIEKDGGIWPSRIRVDHGVENVLVCEAMVENRGGRSGKFHSWTINTQPENRAALAGCVSLCLSLLLLLYILWYGRFRNSRHHQFSSYVCLTSGVSPKNQSSSSGIPRSIQSSQNANCTKLVTVPDVGEQHEVLFFCITRLYVTAILFACVAMLLCYKMGQVWARIL